MAFFKKTVGNGVFQVTGESAVGGVSITFNGTFDGATLKIGYLDITDTFEEYKTDATFTAPDEKFLICGLGKRVAIEVTLGTAPAINLEVNPNPTGRG